MRVLREKNLVKDVGVDEITTVEQVLPFLARLSPRREMIVRRYYGIDCIAAPSMGDIANELGHINRSGISQQKQRALVNIRCCYYKDKALQSE
jgi:hypothetical protein